MDTIRINDLVDKWKAVLEHPELPKIADIRRRNVTAQLMENQAIDLRKQASEQGGAFSTTLLGEARPTNSGVGPAGGADTAIDIVDPVLISLVRRAAPNLVAHDLAGVQPMTQPTGLVFAMRSLYDNQSGDEAQHYEANTVFSGSSKNAETRTIIDGANTAHAGTDPADVTTGSGNNRGYTVGTAMTTAQAEALGSPGNEFNEMAFKIESFSVTAKSRALRADYSVELAQDLQATHGLNAEQELSNILSTEILSEINREVIRTINYTASEGAQKNVTTPGIFDLDTDANGRWSVERFKGLMFQIDRDANAIAKASRRGRGNVMITSSDIASALSSAGVLDYNPALATNFNVDDTGNTFAGIVNGRIKVYIDPYFDDSSNEFYTIGYKGPNAMDAGIFYCPYVPLQMARAIGENTFQPRIGFKTRYAMAANPFATTDGNGVIGRTSGSTNIYYRRAVVQNLM